MVLRGLPTPETLDIHGEKSNYRKQGLHWQGGGGGGARDTGFTVMGVLGDMAGGG